MKKIYKYIFIALVVAFLAIGGVIGALSSASVQEKAGKITSETISDIISLKADIGNVSVNSFRDIVLNDIVLYDKNGEVMLKASEVEFTLRLLSVFTDSPSAALEKITVKSPSLYLTVREDGEVNLSDIKMEGEGESAFKSLVMIEDGAIYGDIDGKDLTFEKVNGKVDIDGDDINYEVAAKNFDSNINIEGFHGKTDEIGVEAQNIDIANYKGFLDILKDKGVLTDDVSIMAGVLPKISVKLDKDGDDVSVRGKTNLKGGLVRVYDTFVDNIDGKATFSDKEILIDMKASANNQSAMVAGSINFADTPKMDLAVKSDAFDISKIFSTVPLKGDIKVDGKVEGNFDNPIITADVELKQGEVNDVVLKDTKAKARIIGKKIYVDEARAKVFNGELLANGFLNTEDLSYIVHAKGEDFRLEYAANLVPEARGLYGDASFDLNFHGKTDDLKNLSVYGRINGKNLNFQNIDIERLNGSFYGNGGELNIDYLSVILANEGGDIGAEGKILPGSFVDLSLYGKTVDLETISTLVPAFKGKGVFDLTAKFTGKATDPNIHLRVASVFGSIFAQDYDSFRTVLSGTLSRLDINEFDFSYKGKNYWRSSGYFGVTGEKPLNIDVETDGARLESIVSIISPETKLTGNLKNIVKLRGTLDNPSATGHLDLIRGSLNGMLIQSLKLDYKLNDNVFTAQNADLTMPLLDANAKGAFNLDTGAMDFDIICNDIDMMRLKHKFPYNVEGHGEFTGKVSGTVDSPIAIASIKADDLVFNGVALTDLRGTANFKDNILTVKNLGAQLDTGSFVANVFADFKNNKISANCDLENIDIESMALLANSKSTHLKGTFTAKAVTDGALKEPHTHITGVIPKGMLGGYDIRDIAVAIDMSSRAFVLERFKGFEGENGEIDGSLSITPQGGMKGNITGKDIDFGLFTGLANIEAKVIGKADINSTFRGDFHNPAADIVLEVRNGGIQGSTFDTLTGNLSLDSDGLQVKELIVNKDIGKNHYSASAKGVVPLKAVIDDTEKNAKFEQNPKNSMDLTLHLDDANLSLIPALSKLVEWAEGETDGTIKLTGSINRPQVHGDLQIKDGSLKLKALRKPITNINLDLVGKGRDINLENFSGNMGSGNFEAKGNAYIGVDDESLKYDFDLNLNALQIDSDYYVGPLSGKLKFTQDYIGRSDGRRLVPKISGNVASEYAQIVVPVIPETDTPTPEILLDIDLTFGKRVHLYEAQLYDMYFSGSAHFCGSTVHPTSNGTIEVKRGGIIKVSHNTFRINSGEVIFNQTGTFLPSVRFFAGTHVGKTKIYVALMGPLGTDKIKPYLTSSPAMSQTEIIRLLTLGTDYQKDSNGTDEVRGLLIAGLQMTALAGVERELKKGLSLDAFSLAHGSGSTFPRHREKDDYYSISTGKYINDKWLLRYNQGLGTGTGNYLLGVTYEMDDRTGLLFEHVDGANIIGIEGRIRF